MALPARPRSPLWLVVLSMVCEEPMHPYRMQVLIKQRGKDLIANVAQRNSVYQTIFALRRAGLITVRETSRQEHRPERTIYEPTQEGRRTLSLWMATVLSTPAREFPDFPAALSLVAMLRPAELRTHLEARMQRLALRLAELEKPVPHVPRLFLIESEYLAAMVRGEIEWLRALAADLRTGRLTWNEAWLRRIVAQLTSSADAPSQAASANSTRRRARRANSSPRRRAKRRR